MKVNPGVSFSTQAEEELGTPENAETTTAAADNQYKKKDPKDRSVPVPVETSIRYLKSRGEQKCEIISLIVLEL